MEEFLNLIPTEYLVYGITLFIIIITGIVLTTNSRLLKSNFFYSLDDLIGDPKSFNKKEFSSKIIDYLEKRLSNTSKPIRGSKVILIILKIKFIQLFITEIMLILYGKLKE